MTEVEHGEPISPLGVGRARLPNDRCDTSLVKQLVWGIHLKLVVEVPQEPSDGPILLSRTGSELSIEGSFDRLQAGVGFPIKGDWDVRLGILPIAT